MSDLVADVNARLPLRVSEVFLQFPVVGVSGAGWGLSLLCPWSACIDGLPTSDASQEYDDVVRRLQGESLIAYAHWPGRDLFTFTNGWLEARPDTDLDPWTLSIRPDLVGVIGSTAESELGGEP